MPLLNTLARLEAVRAGRAQALATVRHRHLSARPLVLVPLTTAGEAGAPLGALVGTDPAAPKLLVVAQPRDRDLRWAFLAALANEVLPYVDAYADEVELVERNETDPDTGKKSKVEAELCLDAPQLVVPSRAGIEYLRLLGRSMRFRRTAEEDPENPYPAPARVPLLGRWLTHLAERSRVPGSSMLLSATDLLARHWATGQSNLEDQHLGALLAWIAPPAGESGAEAALRAELARDASGQLLCPCGGTGHRPRLRQPAAGSRDGPLRRGPLGAAARRTGLRTGRGGGAGPRRDAAQAHLGRGVALARPAGRTAARRAGRGALDPRPLVVHGPPGPRTRGRTPQPRHDDAVTAAQKLATRETEQVRLDAQEALDDPLVMAGRRLSGEAFAGEVTEVVMEWTDSKRPSPRPLVTVATEDRPQLAEDGAAKVFRSLDGRPQSARFVRFEEDGGIVLRLLDKMGRGRDPEPGSVPEKGDRVCWTLFEHDARGGPKLPDPERTPWTHGGPPGSAAAPTLLQPDAVTDEDLL